MHAGSFDGGHLHCCPPLSKNPGDVSPVVDTRTVYMHGILWFLVVWRALGLQVSLPRNVHKKTFHRAWNSLPSSVNFSSGSPF